MIYHSTRNEQLTASSTHAVLQGIAPDGGLYICDPAALRFDWRAALEKDTLSMAADILHALLPDFQDMDRLVRDSYAGKFPTSDLTPLTPVADKYVLELYHGPTSAFKDVALSVLPRLIVAAAKAEGMTEVPCVLVEHLTDAQRRAYILADNRLAEQSGWDTEMLALELGEIQAAGMDLTITGFSAADLEMEDPNEEPPAAEDDGDSGESDADTPSRAQDGDVWKLGDHVLLCGNCTEKPYLDKIFGG